jgi:hypothetical protein
VLSAGVLRVSQSSVTAVSPGPRLKTVVAGPSATKTDLPLGSQPVMTRRIGLIELPLAFNKF